MSWANLLVSHFLLVYMVVTTGGTKQYVPTHTVKTSVLRNTGVSSLNTGTSKESFKPYSYLPILSTMMFHIIIVKWMPPFLLQWKHKYTLQGQFTRCALYCTGFGTYCEHHLRDEVCKFGAAFCMCLDGKRNCDFDFNTSLFGHPKFIWKGIDHWIVCPNWLLSIHCIWSIHLL